ncbi:PIR Superfamily Protein [Plasmodium ovale curtisi]|uniref:PIR Superfamily Protein n=1 Tax=Plasmodium ovale curtisi TaxID=864141 RepID=A0A1A8XF87_PLAOA|nr:PIR Superfamily Protein [Plasmodium ovale curtisi]
MSSETYASRLNDIQKDKLDFDDDNYIELIKKTNNPFLQHIFYYMIRNYSLGNENFAKCKSSIRDAACQNFKKWITLKKDLFTYGGQCTENETLWYVTFNQVWNKLERDSYYGRWCTIRRNTLTTDKTYFPEDLKSPDFSSISVNSKKYTSESNDLVCPPCSGGSDQVHHLALESFTPVHECSSSTTYGVPMAVGFTLLGTFVILSFLYKFTNIISWLYSNQTRKTRKSIYIDENEECEMPRISYDNDITFAQNRRNRISYHSLKN